MLRVYTKLISACKLTGSDIGNYIHVYRKYTWCTWNIVFFTK